jgi:hypothetical protein
MCTGFKIMKNTVKKTLKQIPDFVKPRKSNTKKMQSMLGSGEHPRARMSSKIVGGTLLDNLCEVSLLGSVAFSC